jgi:uncharacterized protein (DUF58 family)
MATPDSRFDPLALAQLGNLTLIARQVVEGFLSGVHKSPFKGFSIEFAEHRQYYPGDEIRHIDWRAYGKTDRYFIKEHEEETNLHANLLIDASGSMAFRGRTVSKFVYAQYVAASLAYLMLHQRDSVGLMVHDHAVRAVVPPRSHSKQLPHLLHVLEATTPGGETALAGIWHRLAGQLRRRGMVIILSDCFEPLQPLLHALKHLRHAGQEVLLLQVLAPEEIDFPFQRLTQFCNLEHPAARSVLDARAARTEYLRNFDGFCRELRLQASAMQIDYHRLCTDMPVDRALGIYLSTRQQRPYSLRKK